MSKIERPVFDIDKWIALNDKQDEKSYGAFIIKSIKDRKTLEERHQEKEFQLYDDWRGMTVELKIFYSIHWTPLARMDYLISNDGKRCYGHMSTSGIDCIHDYDNGDKEIVTLNSIYYLEKVKFDE